MKRQPATVILGPRQVGKTTLARKIAEGISGAKLHLDLEKASDRRQMKDPEQFLELHRDKTIIIDEAQLIPEVFSTLRPAD